MDERGYLKTYYYSTYIVLSLDTSIATTIRSQDGT